MREQRDLLRHFLAALAYRTQKALRSAPPDFGSFRAGSQVRTPQELVLHMTSVLGYATTFLRGGRYRPEPLADLAAEIERFHEALRELARLIAEAPIWPAVSPEQLLQGPLADAMTHAGQLAMLRRLAGSPVAPENFVFARVSAENLGADQPLPEAPAEVWPEAPGGGSRAKSSESSTPIEAYPMPAFPALTVRDLEASVRWYCEGLGFSHVFTMPGPDGVPALVHLRWAKYADLLLYAERGEAKTNQPKGLGVALNFAAGDVEQLAARARRHGAQIVEGPVNRPWNVCELAILDPDGYRLVFNGPRLDGERRSFAEIVAGAAKGFKDEVG